MKYSSSEESLFGLFRVAKNLILCRPIQINAFTDTQERVKLHAPGYVFLQSSVVTVKYLTQTWK